MAVSPHQPQSLSDKITKLKAELAQKEALRDQMEALGQTTSGAGTSTTYVSYNAVLERIDWLNAQIESLTAQLVGDAHTPPGVILQQYRSDYSCP